MVISRLQWTSPEKTSVWVNGTSVVRWPSNTGIREDIESYILGGGIILAARPRADHIYTGIDSNDPQVMYRLKTVQEIDAEKQEKADNLLDYKIALKALAQVTWNSVPALKTVFPTYDEYQTAIINRYKDLI